MRWTSKAHDKDVNSVCVSPNDKLIASGSSDKTAKVWRAADGSCLAVLRGHKRGVWCVSFSTVDQVRLRLEGSVKFHVNLKMSVQKRSRTIFMPIYGMFFKLPDTFFFDLVEIAL